MKNKNILIISPFFFPEPISTGKFNTSLANSLVDKGHEVTVLCFHPFYPEWRVEESSDEIEGIKIIRGGKNLKYPSKPILRRIILEISFLFFILRKLKKHQKGKDIILPIFPPSFAFFASLFFLKKGIKKIGMVHDLQQIYASNKRGILNKLIVYFINKIESKCYSNCDKLIFLSQEMKDQAKKLYKLESTKLEVQYPFISLSDTSSNNLSAILPDNRKKIVYSGALGEKQNPNELYNFFNYTSKKIDGTSFYFFSQGTIFNELKNKNKNKNIHFYNLVKKENLKELYDKSDIQIIPQLPNTSVGSLPSKLPNLLASGCKTLIITDPNSEIEQLFKDNNLEKVITSWDFNIIINALKSLLMSENDKYAQKLVANKFFTIDKMIDKIIN